MELELREGIAAKINVPAGHRDILVFDTKQRGFFIRKYVSGKAEYGTIYTAGGKRRRVMLGRDASVKGNLVKARQEAEDIRAKARIDGRDVLADRKAAVAAAARAISFLDAAKEYLKARKGSWRPRYYVEVERCLIGTRKRNGTERTAAAWKSLHGKDIGRVDRQDIKNILGEISEGKGPQEADKAKVLLSGLYSWAVDEKGWCEVSPVFRIKARAKNMGRERTLSAAELWEVWAATEAVNADYRRIVRLLILTGQRRDEIGQLTWSEAAGDRIQLAGSRTKNHRPHLVPLSSQALTCIPERREGRPFVFGRRAEHGYSGGSVRRPGSKARSH